MKEKFYILVLYLYLQNFVVFSYKIQCVGENHELVDWCVVYKIPKIKNSNHLIQNGLGYVYLTSKNHSQWKLSNYSINDTNSAIGSTLAAFYNNKNDILHVFYNDQPPNNFSNPSKGHTKGVLLADNISGLWLIHSVPHFPPIGSEYSYPHTGVTKGQSFLCISMNLKNLNKVGVQLQYNEPQIYSNYIPSILQTKINEIVKAVDGAVVEQSPWFNKITLTSTAGVNFVSFAKSKKFGKDLYEDWLAPDLQSNLFVETWLNGEGKLPSNCSKPFKVYNVKHLTIPVGDIAFNSTEDHSKWTVSQNSSWICIGDINRMEHQKQRGGGTVCLNNNNMANIYKCCVKEIEKCNNLTKVYSLTSNLQEQIYWLGGL